MAKDPNDLEELFAKHVEKMEIPNVCTKRPVHGRTIGYL